MDLREARFKRRMSQWALCKITGIPQPRISLIENGYIISSKKERKALAKGLGVKVEDIDWPEY